MAETDNLGVDANQSIPSLNELQSEQMSGLVNPYSIEVSNLNLPEPPKPYPVNIPSSNLIPTQSGDSDYNKLFSNITQSYQDTKWANDVAKYAKEESYNADYDGANFERYYKVGSVFKDRGFSPYRDNEEIYNKEATWFDYYKRSFGAMGDGFVSGFTDMLPWNSWSSDLTDVEAARNMERAHAIGADTRGGFGSFVNNMTVDFGYTAGILGEFAAEEIAMWAGAAFLAPESGGTSLATASAESASQFAKLKKLMDLKTYGKALSKSYDWVRNADKMKDIYSLAKSGAKGLGRGLTAAAEGLIPETFKYADELADLGKKGELVFDLAKTAKGFGALYRDARRVTAATSESAMEGGSAELAVRDRLADEIYAQGKTPTVKDWERIYAEAANAGRETFWWNLPVLFASNAIVFDKAFKGFKPMEAFREELTQGIKGKLTFNQAWKQANQKAWKRIDTDFMSTLKSLTKPETYRPKNLLKNGLNKFVNYTKANFAEGFQEVYQDAVQKTMTDYYANQFINPAIAGSRSTWGAFADNAGMLNPFGESRDTFLSGFLMGSMAHIPQAAVFEWAPKKFWQITDKEGYDRHQLDLERHTNSVVDALNAATMDERFFDAITVNGAIQFNNKKEAEEANMAGDKRNFYTITDDAIGNHLHTLISTGKLNLIKDQLEDYKQLTPEELQEAFGPIDKSQGDPETFYQNKIDNMLHKLDLVQKHTEEIEKRFPNPFNPGKYNKQTNPEAFQSELFKQKSFDEAKKAAIMSSYHFDRSVERLKSVTENLIKSQPLGEANATDFSNIVNRNNIDSAILALESEVEIYSKGDADAQKKAASASETLEDLKAVRDGIMGIQLARQMKSKEDAGVDTDKVDELKRSSKIKSGTKVLNKKGEAVVVYKTKGGYAYDKAGNRIGKTKNLTAVEEAEEDDFFDVASKELYRAYDRYLKNIARKRGGIVQQKNIDKSFQDYKDLFLLGVDMEEYADYVDTLHNPTKFLEYAARAEQALRYIEQNKRDLIEKAYREFLDRMKDNDFFVELYKMGVFLDQDGMDDFLDGKVPSAFYDISSKNQIDPQSQKFKDIMELFDKYEKSGEKKFTKKPITDRSTDPENLKYSTATRNKINDDKRTLRDHAQYWGFDPDLSKSSKVNTIDILNKIITSPYATSREKELAKRLLTKISPQSEITFSTLPNPGVFAYDAAGNEIGTIIDPRYMSEDYEDGTLPIEKVILHELIHEITSTKLAQDPEFRADITKLLEAAKEAYKKNPPKDKVLYKSATDKEFYGLKNEFEFLSELFSNDRFKTWLKTIPYENTGKSLWEEFTEKLRKFLSRMLGVKENDTLLDEALYIATTYIEGRKPGEAPKSEVTTSKALTKDSSIESLREAGLLPRLLQAFKDYVNSAYDMDNLETLSRLNPRFINVTKEQFNNLKDDDLVAGTAFRNYLGYTNPGRILNEYNRKAGLLAEPTPETKATTTPTPTNWNSLIANAVSEKELDAVMDQIDNQGVMTPELMTSINQKRDTFKKPAESTTTDARADIEKLGKQIQKLPFDTINKLGGLLKTKTKGAFKEIEDVADAVAYSYYTDKNSDLIKAVDAELAALEGKPVKGETGTQLTMDLGEAEEQEEKPKPSKKNKPTIEQKKDLKALGFTPRDYATMTSQEAEDLINQGLTKQEIEERDKELLLEEEERKRREKEETVQEKIELVKKMIDDAEFLEDFKDIDSEISSIIAADVFFNPAELEYLIQKKKQQLAKTPIFEDIKVNEIIQLNNKAKYIVVKVTPKNIQVRKANDITAKVFSINIKQFDETTRDPKKQYVTMRIQPGVEGISESPVLSKEDKKTIVDNFKDASSFTDEEELKADIANGKKLTKDERRNNILNNIKSCGS